MTYDDLITDMSNYDHGSYIQTAWQGFDYLTDVIVKGRNAGGHVAYTREVHRDDETMDVLVIAGVNRWLAGLYRNQMIHTVRTGVVADAMRRPALKDLDWEWKLWGEPRTHPKDVHIIEYGKNDDSE